MSEVKDVSKPRPAAGTADDLAKVPIDRLLATLSVMPAKGLSDAEAQRRLAQYGPNALVEKKKSIISEILEHFTGPIAYMIEAAALVSALIGHWEDFAIITALLFFNAGLEFWQDRKASNALAALKKGLAPEATVLRDGKWSTLPAATRADCWDSRRTSSGSVDRSPLHCATRSRSSRACATSHAVNPASGSARQFPPR